MSFGRIVCVFVPFALTIASIITLLVACLAGITSKDVYSFKINTTDFSMSVSEVSNLLSRSEPLPIFERDSAGSAIESAASSLESSAGTATSDLKNDFSDLIKTASAALASATSTSTSAAEAAVESAVGGQNITASDLGLADSYYVSLWNYCSHSNNGTTTCSKSKFDWASNATKTFENKFDDIVDATGANATLPTALKDGMKTFATVNKWTEICFIISFIFLGATIIFGIFANCTRFFSICATLVAVVAALAVIASASLATGSAAVVVGLADGTAKKYGVTASFNKHFLINVWLAAAFIIVAVLFWTFSICCCAPDHHKRNRRSAGNNYAESAMPVTQTGGATGGRGYQRLADPEVPAMSSAYAGAGYGQGETGYSYNNHAAPGSSYEPYKHTSA